MTTHIDSPKEFGQRLKAARERAGLSQRQLSFPGCTAAYISRLEAGARVPSLQMVNQLAARLNVRGQWLATGSNSEIQPDFALPPIELDFADGDVQVTWYVEFFGDKLEEFQPHVSEMLAPRADNLYEVEYMRELRDWAESLAGTPGNSSDSVPIRHQLPGFGWEVRCDIVSKCGLPASDIAYLLAPVVGDFSDDISKVLRFIAAELAQNKLADLNAQRREANTLERQRIESAPSYRRANS